MVARAREGDHEAFRILVERYQGRAYRLALRVLRDEERARDAVQEGFLKAYMALDRFEGRSGFYTWLYRLVLNLCLDMRRRDRSDREVEWYEERSLESQSARLGGGSDSSPSSSAERAEVRKRVAEAIDTLPHEARETLLLREMDGLSYGEISKALNIPKGTVMSRLHYARKKVQQVLIESGFVDDEAAPAGVELGGRS